jgi:hypothetical protein
MVGLVRTIEALLSDVKHRRGWPQQGRQDNDAAAKPCCD